MLKTARNVDFTGMFLRFQPFTIASIILGHNDMAAKVTAVKDFAEVLEHVRPGSWVALSNDESVVIASDRKLEVVVRVAAEAGEDEPLYYFKPDESEGLFVY
ncbi:MAG: hypothetical protein ACM336_14165 [Acidobacteriota bacterium]